MLSAVLIVLNEEKNLRDCLADLAFCDEIIAVDSGSHDASIELARSLGAKVFSHPFKDFATQKNFAIGKATGDWVLLIDADERVSADLAFEIKQVLSKPNAEGYFLKRLNRIFDRWMKHGDSALDRQLRLVRKDKAVFKGPVHERIYLEGSVPCLKNPLLHHSTPDVRDYMKKLNLYTTLEAQNLAAKKESVSIQKMKRAPLVRFFYLHWLKRGFLDGAEGLFFSILSAYYEFIRRAKHWELTK